MTAVAPGNAMHVVWRFARSTTLIVLAFSMAGPVLVSLQQAGLLAMLACVTWMAARSMPD